jgi:hypothetical protein
MHSVFSLIIFLLIISTGSVCAEDIGLRGREQSGRVIRFEGEPPGSAITSPLRIRIPSGVAGIPLVDVSDYSASPFRSRFPDGSIQALEEFISVVKISDLEGNFFADMSGVIFFGRSVASLGDLDGDGVIDLAVGAHSNAGGSVYILFLNQDGTVRSFERIDNVIPSIGDFAWSMTGIGDLNEDGAVDLAVGAKNNLYILFLTPEGLLKSSQRLGLGRGNFGPPLQGWNKLGISIAALGDLNGDGVMDLAVGDTVDSGPNSSSSKLKLGAVYFLFMKRDGTVDTWHKMEGRKINNVWRLEGGDEFGSSLAALGDLDGDGTVDLAVGAYGDQGRYVQRDPAYRGALYILFLNSDGTVKRHTIIDDQYPMPLENFARFGASCVSLGDINGDGTLELAVGASGDDDGGPYNGAVYIFSLASDGNDQSYTKISDTQGNFTGFLDDDQNNFGDALTVFGEWTSNFTYNLSRGDLDGNGVPDLVVGTPLDDDGNRSRGAVYTLFINSNRVIK